MPKPSQPDLFDQDLPPPKKEGPVAAAPKSLMPPGPTPKRKRNWKTRTIRSWIWLFIQAAFLFCLIVGAGVGYFAYQKALVYYAKAETYNLKKLLTDLDVTSTFYDVNGEELGRIFTEDRILLRADQIPDDLRHAILSAEDRRFYKHGAIDYTGIARAMIQNLGRRGMTQGGSTIEQQLAKNLIGDFSRSVDRKLTEAYVALRLEREYPKDEILNYYMNRIYFGKGYFGVGAAARGYFGKDVKDLTIPECALLAGIIRAPTTSSPRVNMTKAKRRRDLTLQQMAEEGYISHEDLEKFVKEPIHIQPPKPSGMQTFVMSAAVRELDQILSLNGADDLPQGITVRTNIDLRLERQVQTALEDKLQELGAKGGEDPELNPQHGKEAQLEAAIMLAEKETGRIRVYLGGRDFQHNQFDHIAQAKRESGAIIQPLLYCLAFDKLKLSPASMINASFIDPKSTDKVDLDLGDPTVDVSKRFLSVQDALTLGNKAAATRVGLRLSPAEMTQWLHRAGLSQAMVPNDKPNTFNPDPMSLSDLTHLYEILAHKGTRKKLKLIRSIQALNGAILYDDETDSAANRTSTSLISPETSEQMTLTLERALRSGPYRETFNDAKIAGSVAGMSGHSEGYRDSWFSGFTPKLIGSVWIGYDDSRPIGSKDQVDTAAAALWGDAVRATQAELPALAGGTFPIPDNLSKVEIDRTTGTLRGWAGLAPQPGGIFVYLRKEQLAQMGRGGATPQQRLNPPRDWSEWLSTYFNQADETRAIEDTFLQDDKRSNIIPVLAQYKMPGLRGDILSSDGAVYATMAMEKNLVLGWPASDQATLDADIVHWMRTHIQEVENLLGVKTSIEDEELIKGYHLQRYQPLLVLENLTPDQVTKVQESGLLSKGFGFQSVPRRNYPKGRELAHVLGYLSRDQKRNKGKYLSGDIIYDRYRGASGLEQVFNDDLTGKEGEFDISTTPDGYARSAAVITPATVGNNIRLTIDSKIQAAAEYAITQRLPHRSKDFSKQYTDNDRMGAVVIEDVKNGNVVAFLSHPSYDPNSFVPAISLDNWNALNNDPLKPLLCRAYRAQYPPGSCFKTVTTLASFTAGVFDPNWVVHCSGILNVGNIAYNFSDEKGHDITFQEGFRHSYNTYFSLLGLKVGRDILVDTARSLGLGSPTKITLGDEVTGMIPDPEYVKRVAGREFGPGDVVNTSIGQGFDLVTPVQMAGLMMAVANEGTIYRPRLVQSVEDASGKVIRTVEPEVLRSVTFDQKLLPQLKEAMMGVIDDGTATIVHRDDIKIAAKTGTAQVGSKTKPRQIAWLCGFLPADDPQYSFAIMVEGTEADNIGTGLESGLLGGDDAGLVARLIFDKMYPRPEKEKVTNKEEDASSTEETDSGALKPKAKPAPPQTGE